MNRRFGLALAAMALVVVIGLVAIHVAGAPRALVIAQAAVGALAIAVAAGLAAVRPDPRSRLALVVCIVALAAMAAPLLAPGVDGLRRWLPIGPLQVQPAALALPVIVWFAVGCRDDLVGPGALAFAALIAAVQPDAQTAAGVLAAAIVVLLHSGSGLRWGVVAVAGAAALGVAALAETLAPVPYVEQVLRHAFAAGGPSGALVVAALIAVPFLPLLAARDFGPSPAVALTALWLGLCAASLSEGFPTPVIGFGLSWVLGLGITLGLSTGARRA